jgi:hypothetical protein
MSRYCSDIKKKKRIIYPVIELQSAPLYYPVLYMHDAAMPSSRYMVEP